MQSGQAIGERLRELWGYSPEQVGKFRPEDIAEEVPEVVGFVLQPRGGEAPLGRDTGYLFPYESVDEFWKWRGRNTQDDVARAAAWAVVSAMLLG